MSRHGVVATTARFGKWRSLEAHLLWEQGVVSSNLTFPTLADREVNLLVQEAAPSAARPREGSGLLRSEVAQLAEQLIVNQ